MPQTGPKTPRGKAAVSRNAEKHGILSNTPVLDIEDPADWDAHLQGTLDSLEPEATSKPCSLSASPHSSGE